MIPSVIAILPVENIALVDKLLIIVHLKIQPIFRIQIVDNRKLSEQCLQLLESMSKHKRPRLFAALEALPRNPQGKISRKQVSRVVLETHALQDGPYPTLTSR